LFSPVRREGVQIGFAKAPLRIPSRNRQPEAAVPGVFRTGVVFRSFTLSATFSLLGWFDGRAGLPQSKRLTRAVKKCVANPTFGGFWRN
jgi:hypothetical protein